MCLNTPRAAAAVAVVVRARHLRVWRQRVEGAVGSQQPPIVDFGFFFVVQGAPPLLVIIAIRLANGGDGKLPSMAACLPSDQLITPKRHWSCDVFSTATRLA